MPIDWKIDMEESILIINFIIIIIQIITFKK